MKDLYRTSKGLATISPTPSSMAITASLEVKSVLEAQAKEMSRLQVAHTGPGTLTGSGSSAGVGGGSAPPPPPPSGGHSSATTTHTGSVPVNNSKTSHTPHGGGNPNKELDTGDAYSITSYGDGGGYRPNSALTQHDRDMQRRDSRERGGPSDRRSRSRSVRRSRTHSPRRSRSRRPRSGSRSRDGGMRDRSRDLRGVVGVSALGVLTLILRVLGHDTGVLALGAHAPGDHATGAHATRGLAIIRGVITLGVLAQGVHAPGTHILGDHAHALGAHAPGAHAPDVHVLVAHALDVVLGPILDPVVTD